MIDARFVPIEKWPGGNPRPEHKRLKSPFEVKFARLLDDLERELSHLRATDIVVEAYLRREQIRNDGWPRSSERPSSPGIVLSFLKNGKEPISFPCDTYLTWESNLRAISLTLTALRSIDRYGVTQHAEQYKGWARLPAAPQTMLFEDALVFLGLYSSVAITDLESLERNFRIGASKRHPDNQATGNIHQFHLLSDAKKVIEEDFKRRGGQRKASA